ncbi:MAG: dual specificity protein phosphatase family protein [Candidatus Margulisiibacteriota bacterium]
MRSLKQGLSFSVFILVLTGCTAFAGSVCQKYPASQVKGEGPIPYNCRVIDSHVYAGGHPLNPASNFGNSDSQVLSILSFLGSKGIKTVIDLENTKRIQSRYSQLLFSAGIKRIHIPLNESKVPTALEWAQMKEVMKKPVYIHCKWGADRTGAVIAKYLVEEKRYSPEDAYKAVISGGSHAGAMGGLKTTAAYKNLIRFFWPNYCN